jgi:hypothetical protein
MSITFNGRAQVIASMSKNTYLNVEAGPLQVSAWAGLCKDQPAVLIHNDSYINLIIFESIAYAREWMKETQDSEVYNLSYKFIWFNMEE